MRRRLTELGVLGLLGLVCGCGEPRVGGETVEDGNAGPLSVYVVNYPLQYLAERIGGEQVRVEFPAPADVDPAYWTPDEETVAGYQGADLVLLNGAGYEAWVEKTTLAASKLVNTSQAFADRYIALEGAMTHSHGPAGEHEHSALAFTTWLDPTLAIEQARAIAAAFEAAAPQDAGSFGERLAALEGDLGALDVQLGEGTSEMGDMPLLGSHPVYQYLASRYTLNLRSVHFEPDEDPGVDGWRELERLLEEHPARWMLWEAEPLPGIAERLRGLGVSSIVFDPCGNAPAAGDWLSVMWENARNLESVIMK
jgi:zinc transport system substrate-binding protein